MSERTSPKSMIRDLTGGPIVPLLLSFALPLFLSNALQAVYNLVDLIVVGNCIGGAGMSAVSIGGDILHLLTFIAMGFSSAGQVLIARSVGAGRPDEVRKTIGALFSFLLAASVGMAILCFFLRFSVLDWLNTPKESRDFTLDYTVTCVVGLPFIYGYNVVSAILRGMGDSRRPFVFIAVAAILNMILDVIFVKYCGMEVFGAALATVIGQGTSFLTALFYLYRRRESFGFDFRPASFRIEKQTFLRMIALGIPMAIQSAAISFSKIVLMAWINTFGVDYSALAGVFNKINTMCGVISQSFTTSGSSMVGQNLGAQKYERARKTVFAVLAFGLGFAAVFTLVMLLAPDFVYGLFTKDPSVLSIAGILTLPIILNFFGAATRSGAFALINGSGRPKINLAIAIIDGMIARIGLAALFGFTLGMGCRGFWMGDALAGFMPLLIGTVFYLSGRWKQKKA
ncbi:MAG: MATE family efflux transporter [Lachnospiraceae bacterium]|nr:MATE family efflux transporter [Lachnospiraceae bacterium]